MTTTFDIKSTAQTFIINQEQDGKSATAEITITKDTVHHLIRCLSLWTGLLDAENPTECKSSVTLPLPLKMSVLDKNEMGLRDKVSQCIEIQAAGASAYLMFGFLQPSWMEISMDKFLNLIHQSLRMFGIEHRPLQTLPQTIPDQADIRPFKVIVTEIPDSFQNYTVTAFRDDCCVISEYIGISSDESETGLKFMRQTHNVMFLEKTQEGIWRHLPHVGNLSVDQARFIAETIRFSVL